jgi:hypothetical protein
MIKVITVNLGRTLFFDVFFAYPMEQNCHLIKMSGGDIAKYDRIFLEAEKYEMLTGMPIDLFINISSMQEMNYNVINKYFDLMRSSTSESVYFYCCNRVEKILPDGSVVRFAEYSWNNCNIIFDELCPWYQKYPISIPPFWRPFDGPIQHRLVQFK